MSSRRSATGMVTRSLDRRRDGESDVQPRIYLRPLGRSGLHVVRLECNEEEIIVSGSRSFAPGTQVFTGRHSGRTGETIITEPPPGRRGASAFPLSVVRRDLDALGIVSADPDELEAGVVAEEVTLAGFGFLEEPLDTFRAVVFDESSGEWETDPLVTLGSVTWTDAETVTIPVTVSDDAPEDYRISIEVVRT